MRAIVSDYVSELTMLLAILVISGDGFYKLCSVIGLELAVLISRDDVKHFQS